MSAGPLSLAVFLQLAHACAPQVPPETLAPIVQVESGFNPYVLRVNGPDGGKYEFLTAEAAAAAAMQLVAAGRSVDTGLTQINSQHVASLGAGYLRLFSPCLNLRYGAQILIEGYAACKRGDQQRCIREALSRYNTGSPVRGFHNGYVARVEAAAAQLTPVIHRVALTLAPASARHVPGSPAARPVAVFSRPRASRCLTVPSNGETAQ